MTCRYLVYQLAVTFTLLCISAIGYAQTGIIKGRITTSDHQPAAHVSVLVKEIKKGTVSADDGSFELDHLSQGKYTLIISFVGLKTQQKTVEINNDQPQELDFELAENAGQLTEVIVVATHGLNDKVAGIGKGGIKPMDLPQSVVVIGKDVLERQQTLRLSEALMNVNGIYMYGNTGGAQEELGGRGYAYNSSNTFKNGARFNNATMPEMSGLEKVEVLKGSAAILFGNVAPGGVINLVTKKPRFERGGEISMRAGSYDLYKPAIDVYGPISKALAYRLNTTYEKSRSFRDEVHAERFYINPSFLVKIGKKTELLLEGDYLDDDRTSDFGVGAINYELIDIPRSRFLGASWSYYKTSQQTATATVTHHLNNNWELRGLASYQHFDSDLFGTARPNANSQMIQPDGKWIRGLQRTQNEEEYYVLQVDLTGHFKTGQIEHTALIGADADRYKTIATAYKAVAKYDSINVFDLDKYTQRTDIPTMAGDRITTSPIERAGVYVQDLVALTKQIKVLAGVRWSYQENKRASVDTISNKMRGFVNSYYTSAFSPRLGIVYQPITTMSIFASYSNSFVPNSGRDINNEPLAPSVIDQFEAGIKNELFKGLLSANVTVYRIVNSDFAQAVLNPPASAPGAQELAGEVTSKGVEVDIMSKPIHGFSFIAGYSFNETKYTESNTYIKGSLLRYNPQQTANASVYYTFSERSALKGFNAGFITYYVGERVAGRSTTAARPDYKLMALPNYMQFDASVGYAIQKVTVRVKLSNLFNKLSYYVHDDNSVNPIAPRQFATTVSFRL
jgi:iron complex outermembrane receptor protein